jgi:hypothetical protein
MNRIKDYAGFIGWFAGLGYIALWPVTAADLGGKPFGASVLCNDGALNLTDFLCKSAHPFVMPSGLHAIGCLSAVFVTTRLLTHAVRRTRRAVSKGAKLGARSGTSIAAPNLTAATPPPRKPAPIRSSVKPRSHFGLRGVPR